MYHPQVRFKAGERASKNPKLFGEAWASLPCLGLNSMQEAVRASVTHRGRQMTPGRQSRVLAHSRAQHGLTPHLTQDDATGPRGRTNNSHPSGEHGFIFYLYMHSSQSRQGSPTHPYRVTQRHFRPQASFPKGWWHQQL